MGLHEDTVQLHSAIQALKADIEKLKSCLTDIKVIEERQKNYESTIIDLRKDMLRVENIASELNISIVSLTNAIATMNGKEEGSATAKKTMWTMFGGLIIAGLVGLTTTILGLREEVAILKTEIITLKAIK